MRTRLCAYICILLLVAGYCSSAQSAVSQTAPATSREGDLKQIQLLHQLAVQNIHGDTALSRSYANTALHLAEKNTYEPGIAATWYLLGRIYGCQRQEFTRGIAYYEKVMTWASKHDSVTLYAQSLFQTGRLYYIKGLYATALRYLFKSQEQYAKRNKAIFHSWCQIYISGIYSEWDTATYPRALEQYKHIIQQAVTAKNDDLLAETIQLYTASLVDHKRFDDAGKQMKSILHIAENNPAFAGSLAQLYATMGDIYLHQNDVDGALGFYGKSRQQAIQRRDRCAEGNAQLKLGNAHRAAGHMPEAERYYLDAFQRFRTLDARKYLVKASGALASLYESLHQFTPAYHYRSLQQEHVDNIFADQRRNLILEQQSNAETVHAKELTLEKKDAHINDLYWSVLIIVLITLICLTLLYLNHERLRTAKYKAMLINEKVILEKELENKKLEEEQLKQKLEFNAKTLTANTLNLIQKNEILEKIKTKAEEIKKASATDLPARISNLMHTVNFALNIDKDWENFKLHFEQVHNNFFDNLKAKYPDLNSNDLKLCALLKLNLDTKEIATIMDISPESVKVARSRLRKKLQLEHSDNLSSFITQV